MAIDQDATEHALRDLEGRLSGVRGVGSFCRDAVATEDPAGVMVRQGSAHDGLRELRPRAIRARMYG